MKRIGPYRILGTIALGGMGEVFLAALQREGGFEKRVALKRALPELMADPSFVELFEREARLAAALQHRNIVQVFDFGRHEDGAWIAMEYVHGVDLKAVLDQQGGLPLPLAVEIGIGCARGLQYAHQSTDARGRALHVVHRDVSPQNVLLSFQGDVKLADFGLAHAAARDTGGDGGLRGKYAYMSPEQADGREVGAASDLFSLGVVLYEALSGHRAFFTPEGTEAILTRVRAARPLVPIEETEVPAPLAAVVARAMAQAPTDRFPDGGAFAEALREAARASGLASGEETLGEWLTRRFPDQAQGNLAGVSMLTPLEITEAADAPITTHPPVIAPEVTATAERPISETPIRGEAPTVDSLPPVPPPGSGRRGLFLALLALLVVGTLAVIPRSMPVVAPDAGVVLVAAVADASAPEPVVDAAPKPVVVDAAPKPAVVDAAPKPVVVDAEPRRPKRPVRPARPVKDAAVADAARVERPARPLVDSTPEKEPAHPTGPRVKVVDGWRVIPKSGLLLRVSGGAGPPVTIRLRPRPTHLGATVDAQPWGHILVDGKKMGEAPKAYIPLRPGKRRLEVRGPDGKTTTVQLEVVP